uniref:Uncharacterized protein n=1 Tax=Tanacetum cinerariifolium TaxID=118510 RepID=A0A699HML8_TANCI|nr:hypothetical protein [Tanacetum cinerariifolium]GEY57138.1 hypothetical protein [Tanacetum cinerariifolium]
MSSSSQIRIARHRRIPHGATTGASGNSDDGVTTVDGASKIGAVGISGVEAVGDDDHDATRFLYLVSIASCGVGDTCLSGILVYDFESSEHRNGETIGATDMGGMNSLMDQPLMMNGYQARAPRQPYKRVFGRELQEGKRERKEHFEAMK